MFFCRVKKNNTFFSGNITQPTTKSTGITVKDLPKNSKEVQLRNAWLKGQF